MGEASNYAKYMPEQMNIAWEHIDRHAGNGRRDKVALYYRDETYTYKELRSFVNRTANALSLLGVGLEQRVMLVLYDSPEAVAGFYGAVKIGAIPVPVNTMYTADDFRYLLNNSRATTVIAHEDFIAAIDAGREDMPYLKNVIVVGQPQRGHHLAFHELVERASDWALPAPTTPDDAAFWLYTSGSTGAPKAAVHLQHDPGFAIANFAQEVLQMTSEDTILSASKFFFAYGLGNSLFFPLATGASVVLLPDRPRPETVFEAIQQYRPTIFFGVPTLYANMLHTCKADDQYDLSSLRLCASAGEALPREIFKEWQRRFGLEILDGIGSTEMLHVFISNRPGQARAGSSGRLVPGYEARIVDENGQDVPLGEMGTLLIKGDSTAACYWNQHDRTKTTMVGEWLNTGDNYCQDEEGWFYYGGRGNDMLKVGGMWVSPVEIEDMLMAHPAVLQAAVVGKRDENDLIKPKAFIVLKHGHEASESLAKEIQAFVKQGLAPFKFPRWVEFADQLPTTATGKIQRFKLRLAA